MLRYFVLAITIGVGNCVVAQSDDSVGSGTMLQFLKSGDSVGVQSIDGTTSVILSTYSKDRFDLAAQILERGRATTNAQQFAAESELVRKELEDYVSRNESTSEVKEKLFVMPLIRTSLGTVLQTGRDYVLIELTGDPKRKCVIPQASIGKIYLDANPIRFFGPRRASSADDSKSLSKTASTRQLNLAMVKSTVIGKPTLVRAVLENTASARTDETKITFTPPKGCVMIGASDKALVVDGDTLVWTAAPLDVGDTEVFEVQIKFTDPVEAELAELDWTYETGNGREGKKTISVSVLRADEIPARIPSKPQS